MLYYNGEQVGEASGSCSTLETKYAKIIDWKASTKENKAYMDRENIADVYNTCLKMSEKRALVAVVLITTGASDKFTQDIEEMVETATSETEPENKPAVKPQEEKKSDTEAATKRKLLLETVIAEFGRQTVDMNETDKENCRIATCKVVWPAWTYFKKFDYFTDIELDAFYKQLMQGK